MTKGAKRPRPQVKVCGITRAEDAVLAAELGASAVGLNFWPESPRFVDPARARDIAAAVPAWIAVVGVFVDQPLSHVEEVASFVGLSAVQLHGHEPRQYYADLNWPVVKALAVGPGFGLEAVADIPNHVMVLLDAHDPIRRGGTGRTIDWSLAADACALRPTVLSGGLRPENVAEAVAAVCPYGVDVASGVEEQPGIKSPDRMRALFRALAHMAPATEGFGSIVFRSPSQRLI